MTFKLRRSCRDVTALVLQGHDRALAWHERWAVRIHWGICGGCRNFGRQAEAMKQGLARWRSYREGDGIDGGGTS